MNSGASHRTHRLFSRLPYGWAMTDRTLPLPDIPQPAHGRVVGTAKGYTPPAGADVPAIAREQHQLRGSPDPRRRPRLAPRITPVVAALAVWGLWATWDTFVLSPRPARRPARPRGRGPWPGHALGARRAGARCGVELVHRPGPGGRRDARAGPRPLVARRTGRDPGGRREPHHAGAQARGARPARAARRRARGHQHPAQRAHDGRGVHRGGPAHRGPRRWRPVVAVAGAAYTGATGVSTLVGQWHRPSDVVAAILVVLAWSAGVCALSSPSSLDAPQDGPQRGTSGAAALLLLGAAGTGAARHRRPRQRAWRRMGAAAGRGPDRLHGRDARRRGGDARRVRADAPRAAVDGAALNQPTSGRALRLPAPGMTRRRLLDIGVGASRGRVTARVGAGARVRVHHPAVGAGRARVAHALVGRRR